MHTPLLPLERIRELVTAAQDARKPHAYARRFECFLAESAFHREILAAYEQDLLKLDTETWRILKASATKRLMRNKAKGWEALFDLLNEAKACTHLAALGCTNIQIIPTSYDHKTPDLKAELDGAVLLCEVKTINIADDERTIRVDEDGPQTRRCLSDEFLAGKFIWTLRAAKAQLNGFPSPAARKLAYVVLNPDESLSAHADDYAPQLKTFLETFPCEGVAFEIVQVPPF